MKITFMVAVVLILSSAGCSNGVGNTATSAPANSSTAHSAAVAVLPTDTSNVYARLPDSAIRLTFPFDLKADRTVTLANGTVRRGLALRFRERGADRVLRDFDASLASAGYHAVGMRSTGANGAGSQRYAKQGHAIITVSTTPAADSPDKGTVWIGWTVGSTAATSTVAGSAPGVDN